MAVEHLARITWSEEHVRRGLLAGVFTIDPAWVAEAVPGVDDAWSLRCDFDTPPAQQGNPSTGRVRFVVPAAPHDYLKVGACLRLFERGTGEFAQVEILE